MIWAGPAPVCLQDFRLLGRAFSKGEPFPVMRYWRVAARLTRLGRIGPGSNSNATTVATAPGASLAPPGEAPGATFRAVHRGAGRWVVVNQDGVPQGEGTMTRAEAEKRAAESGG